MRPGDLSTHSVNFPCDQETIRQLPSAFHMGRRTSVNFPHGREIFRLLLSTFSADIRPSSSFVNIPCGRKTFHQLLPTFHSSLSVQLAEFPSIPPNFRVAGRLLDTIHQLFVPPGNYSSTFHTGRMNFCLLSTRTEDLPSTSVPFQCRRETFLQVPSTFCTAGKCSVNFR